MSIRAPLEYAGLKAFGSSPALYLSYLEEYWQYEEKYLRTLPMRPTASLTAVKLGVMTGFMASIRTTPCRSAVSIIFLASAAFEARGFSHSTCFPCSMQRMLWSA